MKNQVIQNPTPEPTLTPVQVSEPKTKFPVMYLVLSLFILVLLASTVFLYYQNRQLKNMLASYQTQPAISPTPATYQSPVPTTDPTANWKTYINQKLGITVKYPSNLFFKEIDPNYGMTLAFDSTSNSETPGSYFDSIKIISDVNASFEFNTLQNAVDGKSMTGYDLHKACGVTVTKLKNIKFGTFEGVEYIFDGSNPPSDCGRDLIGYEHTILIRKSDSMFIKILNGSMKKENTNQHDLVFNQILSTLKLTN